MARMNPDVKAQWVAALRSGKYKQGKSQLKSWKGDEFCCWGVLCDISGLAEWDRSNDRYPMYFDGGLMPPIQIMQWAGLKSLGDWPSVEHEGESLPLHNWNDGLDNSGTDYKRLTFPEIADLIEEQL